MSASSPERIVAVRCFQLEEDEGALWSVFVDYTYRDRRVANPGPPRRGWHGKRTMRSRGAWGEAGLLDERGFYALKPETTETALARLLRRRPRPRRARVCGIVRLFGTVVEHELGYRAQGLFIDRLAVLEPEIGEDVQRRLQHRYRVPVDRPRGEEIVQRASSWLRYWLYELWDVELPRE